MFSNPKSAKRTVIRKGKRTGPLMVVQSGFQMGDQKVQGLENS